MLSLQKRNTKPRHKLKPTIRKIEAWRPNRSIGNLQTNKQTWGYFCLDWEGRGVYIERLSLSLAWLSVRGSCREPNNHNPQLHTYNTHPYLSLRDPVSRQLHHGEVTLPYRPLDVVKADANRRFLPVSHRYHHFITSRHNVIQLASNVTTCGALIKS